ncbi:hypothetical protein Tco_0704457 [Tanacetum coccineum]|uniref:Reverse transcriptase Ty1/copia-type domain-containing protein n=1 Tax=Tanacetum coccineum TaxID=301880 RepID=A0ABQ4Y2M6_9ASTR
MLMIVHPLGMMTHLFPVLRLEPMSDKESPEVEIVQEKEEETTKDTENSAKRQKTSEYEAYVYGESSSGQVNVEEPGPSTSESLCEDLLHKEIDERGRRRKEESIQNSKIGSSIKDIWELGHEHSFSQMDSWQEELMLHSVNNRAYYKNLNKINMEVHVSADRAITSDATLRERVEGLRVIIMMSSMAIAKKKSQMMNEVEFLMLFEEEIEVSIEYRDQMKMMGDLRECGDACTMNPLVDSILLLVDVYGFYRDEGTWVIFMLEDPFCKNACVNASRFYGRMITICKGNNSVTCQMARSHPRFKHQTNAQCNKMRPLLKASAQDELKDECVSMSTPMATERLDADLQGTPTDQTTYRRMIGGLMYLTASRPDIAFATVVCALYQARPTVKHLKEVKQIFWTEYQLADLFTKALPKERFEYPVNRIVIIMAQQQHAADVHPDELCPPNKRYDLMDANKKVDLEHVQCPPESKILMNIIKNHPLRFSIAASSSVPWIYMAQFLHTLKEDRSRYRLTFMLDKKELSLTLDDFRTFFTNHKQMPTIMIPL